MISKEDIKRLNNQKYASQKDATHKDTPIDRYNEPMYQKNASHRNTHHTRQGGRTDHSTSSHGLSPSGTDRVMGILRNVCVVIWGYSGIWADKLIKEIKIIRDIIWK
tara:strand:+ start:74 stop:394 length:321 start_codon:yes stop_codon:yes gene_type:complete